MTQLLVKFRSETLDVSGSRKSNGSMALFHTPEGNCVLKLYMFLALFIFISVCGYYLQENMNY